MHRMTFVSVWSLALAACVGGHAERPASSAPVAVRVAPVSFEAMSRPVIATGVLGPKEEVPLSFKIGGIVSRVLVDEGRLVGPGDTLAILDLSEIDAAVVRARSAAEKAERDLARAQRLYADSVATLEQTQNAQTGRDVAAAELATALFNRRYAVIVAPSAGVILGRNVEPGELASAGAPVFTLGSRARGTVVRVAVADRDVVRLHLGDRADIHFDALPDRGFDGRVREIAAAADPATGTYRVEIAVAGAVSLASGLVGSVEMHPRAAEPTLLVPVDALLEADGNRALVFALSSDGQRAERRPITIGFRAGDRVAVTGGLAGVRTVITDGAAYLDNGTPVRVQP